MYDNRFKQADIATETKFAVTESKTQTATEGTIVSIELVSDTGAVLTAASDDNQEYVESSIDVCLSNKAKFNNMNKEIQDTKTVIETPAISVF